jgi:putative membrane protein
MTIQAPWINSDSKLKQRRLMTVGKGRLLLPDDAWNRIALAGFLVLLAVSCIRVPYPKYFWLQHVPTVAVVIVLALAQNRLQISRLSYTLILAFMLLHVLGARYLYSYVPYDNWSQRLMGYRITDRFGFTRNHYDRVVHFLFGLLLVVPAWRFSQRFVGTTARWGAAFAFSVIMATSAVYEVFEWLVAVVLAPDWAESYNGQQGDMWDAQRDMALAGLGAILSIAAIAAWHARFPAAKTEARHT